MGVFKEDTMYEYKEEEDKVETRSFRCPECGRRQKYLADETPDGCYDCGWKDEDEDND